MADFTPTQGRYLAFIHAYTNLHGIPPSVTEIAEAMLVSPPSVNQMVKAMEKKGLILRKPGQARSIQILVAADEIPAWNARKTPESPAPSGKETTSVANAPAQPAANLYVLSAHLSGGPIGPKFANKAISRTH